MGDQQSKDGHQGTCSYCLGTNHLIFDWGRSSVFKPEPKKKEENNYHMK